MDAATKGELLRTEKIGPYSYLEPSESPLLTEDPILLVNFILPITDDDRVLDIGTGAGIIPLLVCEKSRASQITAVEIDRADVELAKRNINDNGLGDRVSILRGDVRTLEIGSRFSTILCNPPYVKQNMGRISPCERRARFSTELAGELKDFLRFARIHLEPEGRVGFILPTSRFLEVMDRARDIGLHPVRIQFIHTKKDAPARFFCVEFKREGAEMKIATPFFYEL